MNTSPHPPNDQKLLDFPEAMRAVIDGHRITKLEWADSQVYCLLRDGYLTIHKADDIYYRWTINDGDILGKDWIVVSPTLH